MEDFVHHVGQLSLRRREVDGGNERFMHGARIGQTGLSGQDMVLSGRFPLPLAVRRLPFDLADALVADAQEKACVARRVAGGADLRDRVAHCAGSGILRGAGALPFTKGRLNCSRTPPRESRSGSTVMSNESSD